MNLNKRPVFDHGCIHCTYLGTYDGYDLYYCPCGTPGMKIPTVVARCGHGAEQYISGMAVAQIALTNSFCMPALRVAYLVARDLELVD